MAALIKPLGLCSLSPEILLISAAEMPVNFGVRYSTTAVDSDIIINTINRNKTSCSHQGYTRRYFVNMNELFGSEVSEYIECGNFLISEPGFMGLKDCRDVFSEPRLTQIKGFYRFFHYFSFSVFF